MEKARNIVIKDVELNWAKLVTPVSPFGTEQWELQIATTDAAQAEQWKEDHLNVKEKDGKYTVALKRKAKKANGDDMEPVRVVDSRKQPLANAGKIGNGSRGNVIVWQNPYEQMGRKGISNSLTAVQVTEMVEYTGSVDFDVEDAGAEETPSADLF